MQLIFLKRLGTGLAIAAPMAYWFATAPMNDLRPSSAQSASTSQPAQHMQFVAADLNEQNLTSLAKAFEQETSELLWSGELDLSHQSEDTVQNVRLSAEAVNLTVVRPREIFSFNNIVGMRTEEKGYRAGLMYSNGEVVLGLGGGICIASTALYKAALESGLKIIERHHHSGPVSYADPGRDAAVSYGWADMRFKNDTDSPILVRCEVKDDRLSVALYGKQVPGRTVEIVTEDFESIPYTIVEKEDVTIPEGEFKVEQKARDGWHVTTVRVIKQDGKLVSREVVSRDTVLPRNKVVLVPPKTTEMPQITLPIEMPQPVQSDVELPLPLPESDEREPLTLPTNDLTNADASE